MSESDAVLAEVRAVIGEVRAERATVDAYRAEVAAWRLESQAQFERLWTRFDELDAEVAAIARRLMNGDT